jgi:competence protein ComFC
MLTRPMLAEKSIKVWLGFWETLAGLFYPNLCQLCREERATRTEGYVGTNCRKQVKCIEPPFCECCGQRFFGEISQSFRCGDCMDQKIAFTSARSACSFEGPVREAIHSYKYQRALWYEPFLAQLLLDAALPTLTKTSWDAVIPVPLFSTRQRGRQFNQAERLAQHLGRALHIPVLDKVLRRTRPTVSQTKLSKKARAENMKDAFHIDQLPETSLRRVILIDDVLTTGATANACALPLINAGVETVVVWTVARSEPR